MPDGSTPLDELAARGLLCEMLRLFYEKGWVSGTGGGICGLHEARLLVAPTGVHKERVRPDDLFAVEPVGGAVISGAQDPSLRPSECTSIFCAIIRARHAGSVMHSHGLHAVLAGDLAKDDALAIRDLEMLKGIGLSNREEHLVPVIENTEREAELTADVERILADPRFERARAILVRDHGAYIWGDDVWQTKKHAEVYHFLFEATNARRR